jgi:hypothetical protein
MVTLTGAVAIAREQQQDEPDNIVAHERYHKLLRLAGNKEGFLRHGPAFIAALMRKDQHYRALDVLKAMRDLQPEFELAIGARIRCRWHAPHGIAANTTTRWRCCTGFDERHPRHPDIPAAHLLSAQI